MFARVVCGCVLVQITNEPELTAAMAAHAASRATIDLRTVELAQLTIDEQLQTIADTDVLVGMHGAGLTHVVYLPDWAGVVELWPSVRGRSCHLQTMQAPPTSTPPPTHTHTTATVHSSML